MSKIEYVLFMNKSKLKLYYQTNELRTHVYQQ